MIHPLPANCRTQMRSAEIRESSRLHAGGPTTDWAVGVEGIAADLIPPNNGEDRAHETHNDNNWLA